VTALSKIIRESVAQREERSKNNAPIFSLKYKNKQSLDPIDGKEYSFTTDTLRLKVLILANFQNWI